MSCLPTISFARLQDFRTYFEMNDSLKLLGGQELRIDDVSQELEVEKVDGLTVRKRTLSILNRAVLPLGKTISIWFAHSDKLKEEVLSCKIERSLTLSSSHTIELWAQKDVVPMDFLGLFQNMFFSVEGKIEILPKQCLLITEMQKDLWERPAKNDSECLSIALPDQLSVDLCVPDRIFSASRAFVEGNGADLERCVALSAPSGMSLSLPCFKFPTLEDFQKQFQHFETAIEMELCPGEILQISSLNVSELAAEYRETPWLSRITKDFGQFLLLQLLLPFGKTVSVKGEKESKYLVHYDEDQNFLNISSLSTITIHATSGDFLVSLPRFGKILADRHISPWNLSPGQTLYIYGLPQEKLLAFLNSDPSMVINLVQEIFKSYNPPGFEWQINSMGLGVGIREIKQPSDKSEWLLVLTAKNLTHFCLNPIEEEAREVAL